MVDNGQNLVNIVSERPLRPSSVALYLLFCFLLLLGTVLLEKVHRSDDNFKETCFLNNSTQGSCFFKKLNLYFFKVLTKLERKIRKTKKIKQGPFYWKISKKVDFKKVFFSWIFSLFLLTSAFGTPTYPPLCWSNTWMVP